jgi:hypothetical protein
MLARGLDSTILPLLVLATLLKLHHLPYFDGSVYVLATLSLVSFGLMSTFSPPYSYYFQFVGDGNLFRILSRDLLLMGIPATFLFMLFAEVPLYLALTLVLCSVVINIDYMVSVVDKLGSHAYAVFVSLRAGVLFVTIIVIWMSGDKVDVAQNLLVSLCTLLLLRFCSCFFNSTSDRKFLKTRKVDELLAPLVRKRVMPYSRSQLVRFNVVGVFIANFDLFLFGNVLITTGSDTINYAIALRIISTAATIFASELLVRFYEYGSILKLDKILVALLVIALPLVLVGFSAARDPDAPSLFYIFSFGLSVLSVPLWSQLFQLGYLWLLMLLQGFFALMYCLVWIDFFPLGIARSIGFFLYFCVCFSFLLRHRRMQRSK